MKKYLTLLLIVFSWQLTFGQDRLKLKSGEEWQVDITKIQHKTVYFFHWENADRGLDSIPKSHLSTIRYDARKLTEKQWAYALTIGAPMLGSKSRIEELLIQNQYNSSSPSWLSGSNTDHPHTRVLPAIMVESEYLRQSNQGLGLTLSFSNSGEAFGYHTRWGHLFLQYENLVLSPFASFYSRSHIWQFRAGPTLNYSRIYRSDAGPDDNRDRQHYLRTGAYVGGSVALYENQDAYFRIVAEYLLSVGSMTFGPYTEDLYGEPSTESEVILPGQNLNMSHGLVGLRYGRKF